MDLIDRLREYASTRKGELAELITEAADALERQTCDDVVSRQAVIDALSTSRGIIYPIRAIESLPSTQPHSNELSKTQMSLDCISRQQAIDAFKKELTTGESKGKYVTICSAVGFEGAKQILEALPSVQPQRKTGKWIHLDECSNAGYSCSKCRKKVVKDGWSGTVKKIKFCPNCGAKMDGSE